MSHFGVTLISAARRTPPASCEVKEVGLVDACTRIQLRNILFATNFSPSIEAPLPYAAELARCHGTKLHVIHVRPAGAMVPPDAWASARIPSHPNG
jgi:hypothetical protein